MRYYAILNPVAGRGRLGQIESKLKQVFDRLGIEGEMVKTISPGDAGHLARLGLKKGYSHFLCIGGDGTVFEIVNGIQDAPVTIGIIPIGEHNLFARSLDCDKYTWENLLEQYATIPRATAVDIGKINNFYFLTSAGFGLCVDNLLETKDKNTIKIKKPSFLKTISSFYRNPEPVSTTIVIDKKYTINLQAYDVQIVNSTNFFYHEAKIPISSHDRQLDLVTLDSSITSSEARKIKQTREFKGLQGVSHIPSKYIVLQKPQSLVMQIDGELLEAETPLICTPANFQIRFLQPQKY